MTGAEYMLIIAGMALVTYLPRMLPLVLLSDLELSPFWRRFLHFIPPAALTALTFPSIMTATESSAIALAGGLVALISAWFKVNLLLTVLAAISAVFVLQLLIL